MADFGQYPLNITLDEEAGMYTVASQYAADAAACGVNATFPVERLAIMQARGAAYGYRLIEQQPFTGSAPITLKVG